jgi:hypothetical protein
LATDLKEVAIRFRAPPPPPEWACSPRYKLHALAFGLKHMVAPGDSCCGRAGGNAWRRLSTPSVKEKERSRRQFTES